MRFVLLFAELYGAVPCVFVFVFVFVFSKIENRTVRRGNCWDFCFLLLYGAVRFNIVRCGAAS